MELSFNVTFSDLLAGKVTISKVHKIYNMHGRLTSYSVDLDLPEIHLKKTLKSSDFHLLPGKIEDTLRSWADKYQRHLDLRHKENQRVSVDDRNSEVRKAKEMLTGILNHSLGVNDAVDWNVIKRKDAFQTSKDTLFDDGAVPDFIKFNKYGYPTEFFTNAPPPRPNYKDIKENGVVHLRIKNKDGSEMDIPCDTGNNTTQIYKRVESEYGFFSRLFKQADIKADFKKRLLDAVNSELKKQLTLWEQNVEQTKQENITREAMCCNDPRLSSCN